MPKKKWEKPKLVVLVRGKPEERILQYCKASWETGATDTYFGCEMWTGDPYPLSDCPDCHTPSAS